jgi:protocatechuate 4,5-dioxygenase, beta chain
MAKIIGGIGTSHIPTIMHVFDSHTNTGEYWEPFNEGIKPLRAWMKEKKPDVCIVVYNDHGSNFSLKNVIPFGMGMADEYFPADEGYGRRPVPTFKGDSKLSCHLAEHFNEKEFDVVFSFELDVDHGFSVPASIAFGEDCKEWPCKFIPLYVGVVQYPQPKGNRCYNLGRAIKEAIESYPEDITVAIMGTGGLSHQLQGPRAGLINQDYDSKWLDGLVNDPESIKDISLTELIRETGSEGAEAIMWLIMRGAMDKDVNEIYRFNHTPISNTNYSLLILENKEDK